MTFGEKMKKLREEKGKTQGQVCNEIHIAISSLRNYEAGRFPDTVQLKEIKKYYQVPYEYLLDDECNNKKEETLKIGTELKLTDTSIKKIKSANAKSDALNFFLENINLLEFTNQINEYMIIQSITNYDLPMLLYICDISEYILDRIKKHKQEDLKEYFEKCDEAIKYITNFTRTSYNRSFFNPSDSCYDLFEQSYFSLKNTIFSNDTEDASEIQESLQAELSDLLDLYNDVFHNFDTYKKITNFSISEAFRKFRNSMENEEDMGIGSKHYKKILGKYIEHLNDNAIGDFNYYYKKYVN